jgi:hypothetical protein
MYDAGIANAHTNFLFNPVQLNWAACSNAVFFVLQLAWSAWLCFLVFGGTPAARL